MKADAELTASLDYEARLAAVARSAVPVIALVGSNHSANRNAEDGRFAACCRECHRSVQNIGAHRTQVKVGENINVRRCRRWELGEGLAKTKGDFVAEGAKQSLL